ncbi:S16 family serine protease [Candidatus Poriferisodalis sp.]|uniref:S16 family serine protease n=1 Tax=Candidatus Poriferisodalis sp. TaxID=3101277 RepID=UPI003B02C6E6
MTDPPADEPNGANAASRAAMPTRPADGNDERGEAIDAQSDAPPEDEPTTIASARRDTAAEERDDLGWRTLAGSLDESGVGWPPPAVRSAEIEPAETEGPVADRATDDDGPATVSAQPHDTTQMPLWFVVAFFAQLAVAIVIIAGLRLTFEDKVVVSPGGTFDVEEFVHVVDHPEYASDASISLVSVRASFVPSLFEVIGGWLDGALEVVEVEEILGERTVVENREDGRLQMDQSTQIAVAVGLEHLGYEIMTPIGARVERVMSDSPAEDALQSGDIVQFVDGDPVMTAAELAEMIRSHESGAVVVLTALDPDGETRPVTVTLADRDGITLLGVIVTTHVEFAELPIDVRLDVDNIGGPSAGLAFTLSVIDALTPEPLTGDLDVTATGTIRHDGSVGPIGGVPQKAHAVVRSGTDLFLVPSSQADEASAVAEPSVPVVGVDSLEEALEAIAAHQS